MGSLAAIGRTTGICDNNPGGTMTHRPPFALSPPGCLPSLDLNIHTACESRLISPSINLIRTSDQQAPSHSEKYQSEPTPWSAQSSRMSILSVRTRPFLLLESWCEKMKLMIVFVFRDCILTRLDMRDDAVSPRIRRAFRYPRIPPYYPPSLAFPGQTFSLPTIYPPPAPVNYDRHLRGTDKRKQEAERIRNKYNDRIPVSLVEFANRVPVVFVVAIGS